MIVGYDLKKKGKIVSIYFISWLVIALGVLNVMAVVVPYLLPYIAIISTTFLPEEFVVMGRTMQILIGFFFIALGYYLLQKIREAWILTVMLLFFSLTASIMSMGYTDLPAISVSLFLLIYMWINRDQFTRVVWAPVNSRRALVISMMIFTFIYGVVGSKYLGKEFDRPIESWTDAMYYTVSTVSTLGFGDFVPTTNTAKWFTIFLVIIGFTTFVSAIGVFVGPMIEKQVKRMMGMVGKMGKFGLKNHIILCGKSEETKEIVEELVNAEKMFVVVCNDREYISELTEKGIEAVAGDPSNEKVLMNANINTCSALIACSKNDALNAFIVVTAKTLNPKLRIIAMASSSESIKKLKFAGADIVISPAKIGGEIMALAAVGELKNKYKLLIEE